MDLAINDKVTTDQFWIWPDSMTGSYPLDLLGWFLLPIGVLLLAWIGFRSMRRRRRWQQPWILFNMLCDEAGVPGHHRRALRRIAAAESLASPITLLLSAETLDFHARRCSRGLPHTSSRRRIERARRFVHTTMFTSD